MMGRLCAIYAWDTQPCEATLLQRMASALSHQGKGIGWWSEGPVGLAGITQPLQEHTSEPCFWRTGNVWIVADVRLDHQAELFSLLAEKGGGRTPKTDTERIAAAYTLWGEQCVYHLQGDFAFLLWDVRRQCLFGARSPIGVRSLVYHVSTQRLLFASEIRSLFEDPTVSRALNDHWVCYWLTQAEGHWDGTIYRDIQVLVPGHSLIADAQGVRVIPFWKPAPRTLLTYSRQEDYTEQFRHLFFEVVQDQIPSTTPVLFDLSGGLDSSSILCTAATLRRQEGKNEPLYGFHALSEGSLTYVQSVVDTYQVQMRYLPFQQYLYLDGSFDPLPWMTQPSIPALFLPAFYRKLWEYASELGIRVHVRGDFGDQLIGTSLNYLKTYWDEHRYGKLISELRRWKRLYKVPPIQLLERWIVKPSLLRLSQHNLFHEAKTAPWLRPYVWQQSMERRESDNNYLRQSCPDPFARELFRWVRFHEDYVTQAEQALSLAGLETREPYADMRLIEFLFATSAQYQVRPGQRKFLLREAMKGILPEIIRQRTEKGQTYRLYFQGIAKHRQRLQEVIAHMPEMLTPYIDRAPLLAAIERVALGDQANVPVLSGTIALVLWAHRLPWAYGILPVVSNPNSSSME